MHSFPAAMANNRPEKGWILGAINSPWAWEGAWERDQRIYLPLMITAIVAILFSSPSFPVCCDAL